MLIGVWSSRGLLGPNYPVDYFEYRNECVYQGAWEVAFDVRMIERANANNICLLAFSDAPGHPELMEHINRRPVLDAMLERECRPGRWHFRSR